MHGQQKLKRFCNGSGGGGGGGHWLPRWWQSDHSRWKLNQQNYVKTLSANFLDSIENMFGDRNHPLVIQHDSAPAHTTCRTVTWLEQQDKSGMQWPSQSPTLNIKEQIWALTGREIVRVMPSLEMIWFKLGTIPGWASLCHICTIFTTPSPEEWGQLLGGGVTPQNVNYQSIFAVRTTFEYVSLLLKEIFFTAKYIHEITFF